MCGTPGRTFWTGSMIRARRRQAMPGGGGSGLGSGSVGGRAHPVIGKPSPYHFVLDVGLFRERHILARFVIKGGALSA